MKKLLLKLLYLACLVAVASCKGTTAEPATAQSVEIQTGDLLLVALPTDYDLDAAHAVTDISNDTGEVLYIHIAMLERAGDSLYVVDATLAHGVDRHPLDTLLHTFTLKDGSLPRLDIFRLNDTTGVAQFVQNAKRCCGLPYNLTFALGDTGKYCSQLVHESYVTPAADTLFHVCPIDLRTSKGEIPVYWNGLFGLIDIPLPQGKAGILPHDIARSPQVHLLTRNYKH